MANIDVYTVWQIMNDLAVKHGTGNSISPDQYNRQLQIQPLKYGEDNYKPKGGSGGFEANYEFTDTLSPFKVEVVNVPVSNTGQIAIPDNYWHFSSLLFSYIKIDKYGNQVPDTKNLSMLSETKFKSRLSHSYKKPTPTKPICTKDGNYFQLAIGNTLPNYGFGGSATGQYTLAYLRYPATPYMNYTVDANDNIIYVPNGSVQFDFSQVDIMKIIPYILYALGERLDAAYIMDFAAGYIKQDANG